MANNMTLIAKILLFHIKIKWIRENHLFLVDLGEWTITRAAMKGGYSKKTGSDFQGHKAIMLPPMKLIYGLSN